MIPITLFEKLSGYYYYMSLICLWSGLMLVDITRQEKEEPKSESDEEDPYEKKMQIRFLETTMLMSKTGCA